MENGGWEILETCVFGLVLLCRRIILHEPGGRVGLVMSYFDMVDLLQCFQVKISINYRLTWRNIYFLDRLFLIVLKVVVFRMSYMNKIYFEQVVESLVYQVIRSCIM